MCFGKLDPADPFHGFLTAQGADDALGNQRFVARNFLLDQGVCTERMDAYQRSGCVARHPDLGTWSGIHNDYLLQNVFLGRPDPLPARIDPASADTPETFRHGHALRTYGSVDPDLHLVRMELAEPIALRAGLASTDDLLALAGQIQVENAEGDPARRVSPEERRMDSILQVWQRSLDVRPVWAGFWEDAHDLFDAHPARDRRDWADELRNRLGLYHYNPPARGLRNLPVLVFRYPVTSLPVLVRGRGARAIAVPTVLDQRFSEAFCPAPAGGMSGFAVHLGAAGDRASREILHPAVHFTARQLFRVGQVSGGVSPDLTDARKMHLLWLRLEAGQDDYSVATDGDP